MYSIVPRDMVKLFSIRADAAGDLSAYTACPTQELSLLEKCVYCCFCIGCIAR